MTHDDQTQAVHLLSVAQAAAELTALVTSMGGSHAVSRNAAVARAVQRVLDESTRLDLFERRAGERGFIAVTTDARLAEAIALLRRSPITHAEHEDKP